MMRLRKIWAEGSFSVLKREHCLSKIRKRGIPAVTEECLLSAMALNLKRMVRAILLTSHMLKIRAKSIYFQLGFLFCQQVPYLTLSLHTLQLWMQLPHAQIRLAKYLKCFWKKGAHALPHIFPFPFPKNRSLRKAQNLLEKRTRRGISYAEST